MMRKGEGEGKGKEGGKEGRDWANFRFAHVTFELKQLTN